MKPVNVFLYLYKNKSSYIEGHDNPGPYPIKSIEEYHVKQEEYSS